MAHFNVDAVQAALDHTRNEVDRIRAIANYPVIGVAIMLTTQDGWLVRLWQGGVSGVGLAHTLEVAKRIAQHDLDIALKVRKQHAANQ